MKRKSISFKSFKRTSIRHFLERNVWSDQLGAPLRGANMVAKTSKSYKSYKHKQSLITKDWIHFKFH